MQLYLVRHGQSENNVLTNIRERVVDPALTELGQKQADRLADYLSKTPDSHLVQDDPNHLKPEPFRVTHLYCSGMLRAMQTAYPISQALGIKPEVWIDIHEFGGMFLVDDSEIVTGHTGMTRDEMQTQFANYMLPEAVTDNGWWDPQDGREDAPRFMARAIRVYAALQERFNDDDIIMLVSHAGFLDTLIKTLLRQLPTRPGDLFYAHYNTGITRFDFNDRWDYMRLHYLNRAPHLTPDMRSW